MNEILLALNMASSGRWSHFNRSPTLHASSDVCSERKGQAMTNTVVLEKKENELERIFFPFIIRLLKYGATKRLSA